MPEPNENQKQEKNLQNQNTQNLEVNNFNQPTTPKEKRKVPTWLGFVIIIGFATLAFGGVFACQYFLIKYQPVAQVVQPQNQPNQTAGWKIYTSAEYGFEFKYPASWNIVSDANWNIRNIDTKATKIISFRGDSQKFGCISSVALSNNKIDDVGKSIASLSSSQGNHLDLQKDVSVGSLKGEEYLYTEYESGMGSVVILVPYGNKTLILGSYDEQQSKDLFNQMLLTFKFVNEKEFIGTKYKAKFANGYLIISDFNNGTVMQEIPLNKNIYNEAQYLIKERILDLEKILNFNYDINFDGEKDIMVVSGSGYMGVNYFYDYYILDKTTGKFKLFLQNVCNPIFKPSEKIITSSCKSGPSYYSTTYKFDGQTYKEGGK